MAKFIILDTETTGFEDKDKIIQLGYIVLDGSTAKAYNEFCSCDATINIEAMEVHNITPEMIEGKPVCVETDAFLTLEALNEESNYLIIHNAKFDLGMLQKEGFESKMKLIDTLKCAKHLFPDSPAHRLQYFRYAHELYKLEEDEANKLGIVVKAHDAIGDVLVLKLFLSKLRQAVEEQYDLKGMAVIEKMVELTATPVEVKKIRFGKYKNELITDIALKDEGYLKWLLKNTEQDEDMTYTIKKALNLL